MVNHTGGMGTDIPTKFFSDRGHVGKRSKKNGKALPNSVFSG
jgi:hypothetical protein